jgi:uncharacterized membrane protein
MHIGQFHYLPLAPGFFSILVALFIGMVLIFAVLGALRHAYLSLGVTPRTAMLLLVGSLVGSYFNIPIAALPPEQVQSDKVIEFFGMQYNVPVVENLSGTVIAINVGGAVIPTTMSLYLLASRGLWVPGAIGTAIVAMVLHWLANPVPGVGIAVPVSFRRLLRPSSRYCSRASTQRRLQHGHPDWCRPHKSEQGAGSWCTSCVIGGAGTFDGIFLTGILAVLLARFTTHANILVPMTGT